MTTIPGHPQLIIGLGCSTSASADEIVALIAACLAEVGRNPGSIAALATHMRKRGSAALARAAEHYDVPLRFLDDDDLAAGISGTCEAVAAAAGPLLLGKRKSRYATCAIAACGPDFVLAAFGQPERPSAAMASSMSATSLAGP
jgi:cobalt-precorrin 5A hydrolase/precorrin-3B C17-methyltransferase